MSNCIFCKIADKQIPAHIIYEDNQYLAFLDAFPKAEGHVLVIPKQHVKWVWEVVDAAGYMSVVQKIARHLQEKTQNEFVVSAIFGNQVHHAHIHLIPSINQGQIQEISDVFDNLSKGKLKESDGKRFVEKLRLK